MITKEIAINTDKIDIKKYNILVFLSFKLLPFKFLTNIKFDIKIEITRQNVIIYPKKSIQCYIFFNPNFSALFITKSKAGWYSLGISPSKIASFTASFKTPISLQGFKLKISIISSPEIGG
jgi:hypothetical protein